MKSSKIAFIAWTMATMFYIYQYILRVFPSVTMFDIISQFNLTPTTFGQFSGAYYIGYALMHIPIGLLLDRYGPKKIVPLFILIAIVGQLSLLFKSIGGAAVIGRFFVGAGSSAAILGLFRVIRIEFKEELFTRMLSLGVTLGLLGAIYGGAPIGNLKNACGFQNTVIILSIFGLFLAITTFALFPVQSPIVAEGQKDSMVVHLREVLGNKTVLMLCVLSGLMVGPLEGFADVWSVVFLKRAHAVPENIANKLPSLIFIGMCVGGPLLSFIVEKTKNYWTIIICCGLIMMSSFSLLLFARPPVVVIATLFFLIGICSAYQILAIYKISTYTSEQAVGLNTAVANMIIMSFGYFFHSVIGKCVAIFSSNSVGEGYSAIALLKAISVIPVAILIAVVGLYLKTRRIKQDASLLVSES